MGQRHLSQGHGARPGASFEWRPCTDGQALSLDLDQAEARVEAFGVPHGEIGGGDVEGLVVVIDPGDDRHRRSSGQGDEAQPSHGQRAIGQAAGWHRLPQGGPDHSGFSGALASECTRNHLAEGGRGGVADIPASRTVPTRLPRRPSSARRATPGRPGPGRGRYRIGCRGRDGGWRRRGPIARVHQLPAPRSSRRRAMMLRWISAVPP